MLALAAPSGSRTQIRFSLSKKFGFAAIFVGRATIAGHWFGTIGVVASRLRANIASLTALARSTSTSAASRLVFVANRRAAAWWCIVEAHGIVIIRDHRIVKRLGVPINNPIAKTDCYVVIGVTAGISRTWTACGLFLANTPARTRAVSVGR